jgi:hypothetical protein
MTTATKTKNETLTADTMIDAANKVTEEAKVMSDDFVNNATQATENAKTMMAEQQKMLQSNLNVLQQYNQSYADFVLKATQQSLDQSLALRQQLGELFEANFKKTQELMTAEQKLVLDATESFQAQFRTSAEQFTKLSVPNVK